MFTFFLFPGHFIHRPIVREEQRYLHTARLPHRVKLMLLVFAFTTGVIALCILLPYMEAGSTSFLPMAIAVTYGFHLIAIVWVVKRTENTCRREFNQQRWENLVLTSCSAAQIFICKWWSITLSVLPLVGSASQQHRVYGQ